MLRTLATRCPSCSSPLLAGSIRASSRRQIHTPSPSPSSSSSSSLHISARPARAALSPSSFSGRRSIHTTSTPASKVPSFDGDRPAPPRLPPHLQKEFEELQRKAATPLASSSVSSNGPDVSSPSMSAASAAEEEHPDLRRKPKPEFEGERNPKTGEVGGPKNDPLAYEKEWTYGGRATDF